MEPSEPKPGDWYDPGPGPYIELYQGQSGRLSPNARPHGANVSVRTPSRETGPQLIVWLPSMRVQAASPAAVVAALIDDHGQPVRGANLQIQIRQSGDSRPVAQGAMTPAPATAMHHYEYRFQTPSFQPPSGESPPVEYEYKVTARGNLNGRAFERVSGNAFWVHTPGGRINRTTLQVRREDGDITVNFTANVTRRGNYWGYAELWGSADKPIAFGQHRWNDLSPGVHTLSLMFGGQVIRDSNVDGPYTVRNIRFMEVDSIPPQEDDLIEEIPPTPDWKSSDFY